MEAVRSILNDALFRRKVALEFETRRYAVRTVEDLNELQAIFRLRHDVFHEEYGRPAHPSGLDIDRYDFLADHLGIFDRETGEAVATYRLLSSSVVERFYSQEEFGIGAILEYPGTKLELGRACVRESERNGIVLSLLWKAIADYARRIDARLIFGCSSIKSTDPLYDAAAVFSALASREALSRDFAVFPLERIPGLLDEVLLRSTKELEELAARGDLLIPSLLDLYLKIGGKVCGEPMFDADFRCLDFFTVLKTSELSAAFQRKFGLC